MWRLFRTAFLRELDTPEPATPVLRAGATDMRMRGASVLNRMRIRAQDRNESKQGDDPE
jgi:hypothetical protein